jgi:hypothetical protein
MKEVKTFRKESLRLEGNLTKEAVGNIIKRMYGSECQVLSVNIQTGYSLVELWSYQSSHVVE